MAKRKGRCYVLRVTHPDGDVLHKIGITQRNIRSRVGEIANSYMAAYGFVPMIEVLKMDYMRNFFGVEAYMLMTTKLMKVQWSGKARVSGYSEFRRLDTEKFDEDWLIKEYEKIVYQIGDNENEKRSVDSEPESVTEDLVFNGDGVSNHDIDGIVMDF